MNKSTVIALLVFVALVIAAVRTVEEKPERGVTRLSMAHIDAAAVDRLLLGGDDGIRIEKVDGRWRVDGKLADQPSVERLIEAVAAIQSSDLASRNPERHGELEVDDEKGTRVRLYAGGAELADLVVGSSARGGSHVRVGDEVYAVSGVYRASFARDRASWVERRLFFDDDDAAVRVEVAIAGDPPYALVARDGGWHLEDETLLPEGQRFDAEAAARMVRALVSVRADEVLDGDPEGPTGLDDGADRLVFRVAGDDRERSLVLGASDGGSVYARSSERDHILKLGSAVVDGVRKRLVDLRDLGIVRLDAQAVKRLAIDDGAQRFVFEKTDGTWQLAETTAEKPEDFELDRAGVPRRLSDMSRLRAVAESDGAVFDAAAAKQKLTATLDDDTQVVVAFGSESTWQDRPVVAAVGNADAGVYLVETAQRDRLLRGLDSFARTERSGPGGLADLDPAALQNLPPEIRDSLLKQMMEEQQRQEMIQRAIEAQGGGS